MQLLLGEDLPSKLRYRLRPEHEAISVQDMGWRGKKNGELLRLMESVGFQALLTGDKQMQHQQNWYNYTLPVLVLDAIGDQYDDYSALIPQVKQLLAQPVWRAARILFRPPKFLDAKRRGWQLALLLDIIPTYSRQPNLRAIGSSPSGATHR